MSFKSMLKQDCLYYMVGNSNQYGDLTHATGLNKKCRFAKSGLKLNQTSNGTISQKSATLWVDNSLLPADNDKVVYAGDKYLVKFVDQWIEGNGQILGYKLTLEEYVES